MSARKPKTKKALQPKKGGAKPKKQDKKRTAKTMLSVETVLESMVEEPQLLADDDLIEPDESLLVSQEDDIEEVLSLHVRETSELAEDPVRL